MAIGDIEEKLVETPETQEPAEAPAPPDVDGEEDPGEPGGADPQAVRARKEYRARRRVEKELVQEREQRIRLEARMQALEEQARPVIAPAPVQAPVRYTRQQLQQAVDAGTISVGDMAEYLAETKVSAAFAAERQRTQVETQERTVQVSALGELEGYVAAHPWLKAEADDPRKDQIRQEYQHFVQDFGMPADLRTQVAAVKAVLGPMSKAAEVKAAQAAARQQGAGDFHAEGGGGKAPGGEQVVAGDKMLAKLPKAHQEYVARLGLRGKELEGYVKAYQARAAKG